MILSMYATRNAALPSMDIQTHPVRRRQPLAKLQQMTSKRSEFRLSGFAGNVDAPITITLRGRFFQVMPSMVLRQQFITTLNSHDYYLFQS